MGLTVRELRALLADLPAEMDEHLVVLSGDPEGNSFDTLGQVEAGWYFGLYRGDFVGSSPVDHEQWSDAMNRVTQSVLNDEDAPLASGPDLNPAICLWP